jgi:hypothetical protein
LTSRYSDVNELFILRKGTSSSYKDDAAAFSLCSSQTVWFMSGWLAGGDPLLRSRRTKKSRWSSHPRFLKRGCFYKNRDLFAPNFSHSLFFSLSLSLSFSVSLSLSSFSLPLSPSLSLPLFLGRHYMSIRNGQSNSPLQMDN